MECKYCGGMCVKDGTQSNGKILTLTKEGVGIRNTARILNISPTTLLSRIIQITYTISQPAVITQRTYEADEIKSLVRGVVLNK